MSRMKSLKRQFDDGKTTSTANLFSHQWDAKKKKNWILQNKKEKGKKIYCEPEAFQIQIKKI